MQELLQQIRSCTLCADKLPLAPNPVVQASPTAKLLIIGQAPGRKVHDSGIPWNDPSGDRLRHWLKIDKPLFYNPEEIAIIPMGFCYPGKGKSGDLPPRPECAPQWHHQLMSQLPEIRLTLLIGQYAQGYYLKDSDFYRQHKTLTERVKHFSECNKGLFPLPHPSPRNQIWLKRNAWFEADVIPVLQSQIKDLFS